MEDIGIFEYLGMLGRRKFMIAAVTVLAVLAGVVLIRVTPHTYRGTATLLFPQKQGASGGLLARLSDLPGLSGSIPQMSGPVMYGEILKSRALAGSVIRDVELDPSQVEVDELAKSIEIDTSRDNTLKVTCYAPATWVKSPGADTDRSTARLAADITNAYIQELETFDRKHSLTSGRHNTVFLENEVAKTRAHLAKSEESLRDFVAAHPTIAPPGAETEQFKQIAALRSLQIQADSDMQEAERAANEARNVMDNQQVVESLSREIMDNPLIEDLRKGMAEDEITRARLLENFTDKHPDVVAIDLQIAKTRDRINQETAKIVSTETVGLNPVRQVMVEKYAELAVKRSGVEARVDALNKTMSTMERQISRRAGDQMVYLRKLRDVKALEMVYTSLLTELNQARVAESKDPESFTVLDNAVPEKKRTKPKTMLTLFAAVILGLWTGSFIAIVQESRRLQKRPPMLDGEAQVPAGRLTR